jgi:hypothetical protein
MAQFQKSIKRSVKKTIFIGTEGDDDKIVIDHLKSLYQPELFSCKVRSMGGGSPVVTVNKTFQQASLGDYEIVYAIVDSDREELEEARLLAEKKHIILLCSEPHCLEGFILTLLNLGKIKLKNTKDCEEKLEGEFGKNGICTDILEKRLPKKHLEKCRHKIKALDNLLNIFE